MATRPQFIDRAQPQNVEARDHHRIEADREDGERESEGLVVDMRRIERVELRDRVVEIKSRRQRESQRKREADREINRMTAIGPRFRGIDGSMKRDDSHDRYGERRGTFRDCGETSLKLI